MSRRFAILSVAALAVFCLFTIAYLMVFVPDAPCDFRLRMNEITCLRDGANPFAVWNGDIAKAPYYPLHYPERRAEGCNEPINAYTPWEYTLMMPFSYLPRQIAWWTYVGLMFLCQGAVFCAGYRFARSRGLSKNICLTTAALALLIVAYPIWSNFAIGNFAVVILAAMVLMSVCLENGHDVLAGICWAVAMFKPQNSFLLAIPLLIKWKWKTGVTAAAICIVATIPPAIMCRTSPINLIIQSAAGSTPSFFGCGLMPYFLCEGLNPVIPLGVAATLGLFVCFTLTWRVRKYNLPWMYFIMPAVMCSMSWSYTTSYSYALAWFFALALMIEVFERGFHLPRAWFYIAAALLLPRFICAIQGFSNVIMGKGLLPESLFHNVESLTSTATLALFAVWWLRSGRLENSVKSNETADK